VGIIEVEAVRERAVGQRCGAGSRRLSEQDGGAAWRACSRHEIADDAAGVLAAATDGDGEPVGEAQAAGVEDGIGVVARSAGGDEGAEAGGVGRVFGHSARSNLLCRPSQQPWPS
jgi:hypothetical protein